MGRRGPGRRPRPTRKLRGFLLGLPFVLEVVGHVGPLLLARGVLGEVLAESVLELLAREDREVPLHGVDVLLVHGLGDLLAERIGGCQRLERLEGGDEGELLGDELRAFGAREEPVGEVDGRLLARFGGLGVDRQEVLGADGDAGLVLALGADVDRQEVHVVGLDRVAVDLGDLAVGPVAVLDHGGLAEGEFGHRVGHVLRGGLRRLHRRILQVEVEDVLEVLEVGSLELFGVGDLPVLELVVDRVVGQVGVPPPVLTGRERSRREGAVDAQIGLVGLDVLGRFLELVEALDLVDGLDFRVGQCEVLVHDGLVVDDAVAFQGEGHAVCLPVVALQRERFVGELLSEVCIGEVRGVLLPDLQPDRAVEVEESRPAGFPELGLESLLVLSRSGGDDLDLDAGLLLVSAGYLLPRRLGFGFEVEIVDGSLATALV